MNRNFGEHIKLKAYSYTSNEAIRYINPMDINISSEYSIENFVQGLDSPIGMVFSEEGDLYIASSGIPSGNAKVIRLRNGHFEVIAEDFQVPLTGINYLDGNLYVSHKGYITVIRSNGTRLDIIAGLPCNGDFGTSNVAFGPDGKIYFGQGTITNSGVVGADNQWVFNHPFLHDLPASDIMLNGQNFVTNNMLISNGERTFTGAFSPYGVPNILNEIKKGYVKASGSILRANRDGSNLELVAWGFRNPIQINFDRDFRLFVANRGLDVRGSRPIANAPDEFHLVTPGVWYGWPDYSAGEPVTLPRFKPEGGQQPEFLLTNHPNIPPRPYAEFPPHTTITGFDFNYNRNFGPYGDVYITLFGSFGPITMGRSAAYEGIGYNISKIDMHTGAVITFINNRSGLPADYNQGGGFGRLVDVEFGPDGAMYILDMGMNDRHFLDRIVPNSGVIWKVSKL
ncbi:MAG: PQQ-dependent sugar dehydrogenase [Mobilitalea sp.]